MSDGHDFGMIGLGTMGRNFIFNLADHGYSVAGLGRSQDKVNSLHAQAGDKAVHGYTDPAAFVRHLRLPRAIMLLVPAGKPVDDVIAELAPILDKGDLIIDGGNSFFRDTERRAAELDAREIGFFGMGVSGGAEGARHGPSMMPGGPDRLWERVKELLEKTAAKAPEDGAPCVDLMGPRGAGHYVKMVHNGIEYAIMQQIAEVYDLAHRAGGATNAECAARFEAWDAQRLQGFLVHITGGILRQKDPMTGGDLVDAIKDEAEQKGTGKWTSQDALDLGIPIPSIDAAVSARQLSALKPARERAAKLYGSAGSSPPNWDELHDALYAGMIVAYAQGFALLEAAGREYGYGLRLDRIARIWRAGCIIRSSFLQEIMNAYGRAADLPNLLLDAAVAADFGTVQGALRETVSRAQSIGIPVPALAASLGYFDGLRSARLPANLIQAQRDDFGSHTYERIDRPGAFHTAWGQG